MKYRLNAVVDAEPYTGEISAELAALIGATPFYASQDGVITLGRGHGTLLLPPGAYLVRDRDGVLSVSAAEVFTSIFEPVV